jgi:DNA-binding transcriptional regulator of glucitol operon
VYRRFLRPGWIAGHLLVLLAALVCIRLGIWQWHRAHESGGTAQNLGYSLLWPVFSVAFVYMWVRFLRLEVVKDADESDAARRHEVIEQPAEPAADDVTEAAEPVEDEPRRVQPPSRAVTLSVTTIEDVDDEEDPELAAYNRALAEIAEKDRRRAR